MTAGVESIRAPGRPRSERVEAAIVDAAIDELAERGHHSFSIENVAARAGVAKTSVYRRWPSKDELVLEALSTAKGPMPNVPDGSVRDQLVYLVDWMRQSWLDSRHGAMMRRLASDGSEHPEIYVAFRDRLVAPRRQLILDVLKRGVDEGLIRADVDLDLVETMMVAPSVAMAMTHRPGLNREQVEFLIDTMLAGLRPS